ncbi:hypothetical protein B0H63DRAFT_549033 [Podospora didyma]|uniref:Uncharacterized protein n=1 Tax=Podospora didyma TaxID=330526 RepID=A0AAE0KEK9_9PEZI|nr:hypothetical protein B0H63DRAFT_549033 [Podospora didyma]
MGVPDHYSQLPEAVEHNPPEVVTPAFIRAPEVVPLQDMNKDTWTMAGGGHSAHSSPSPGWAIPYPQQYQQQQQQPHDGLQHHQHQQMQYAAGWGSNDRPPQTSNYAHHDNAFLTSSHMPKTPAGGTEAAGSRKLTIWILSILVGIFAAAVIALAVVTGEMSKRASAAENTAAQAQLGICTSLGASCSDANVNAKGDGGLVSGSSGARTAITTVTVKATVSGGTMPTKETGAADTCPSIAASVATAPAATFNTVVIQDQSNGCGEKDEKISGTNFVAKLFGKVKFEMYCNSALGTTNSNAFAGLMAQDFEACMNACAGWTFANSASGNSANGTCAGVNYVPAYSNKTLVLAKNARGNCYLKGGPENKGGIKAPDGGYNSHAAFVVS